MSADIAAKLDEARALIEKGWCQGSYARNRTGRKVSALGRAACSYCTTGALERAIGPFGGWYQAIRLLKSVTGTEYLPQWNDAPERTQAEVIEAFRKAAELARKGEQA